MFLLRKPSSSDIQIFLKQQTASDFSYPDVGATRSSTVPSGYIGDHNRMLLDKGAESWDRSVEAIKSWSMFEISWLELCWPNASISVESTVAVLVHHFGFYSLNPTRIVYVIDEVTEKIRRFGFAYGTLPEHSESGEERFSVEWDLVNDSVWYDIFAFSRPRALLARAASPLSRKLQKRFARDSQLAMVNRVRRS